MIRTFEHSYKALAADSFKKHRRFFRVRVKVHFAIYAILAIFAIGPARSDEVVPQDLVAAFRDVMPPDDPNGIRSIHKWSAELRVTVLSVDGVRPELMARLSQALAELRELTGLKVHLVSDKADFVIMFVGEAKAEFRRYRDTLKLTFSSDHQLDRFVDQLSAHPSICSYSKAFNSTQDLAFFIAIASADKGGGKFSPENCLMRGLLNGIGIGPLITSRTSVFNPDLNLPEFSNIDRALVRNFYNPAMRSGMSIDQAARALEELAEKK